MVARGKFAASAEQAQNRISRSFSGVRADGGLRRSREIQNESKELW
jgi:hypothetical protein